VVILVDSSAWIEYLRATGSRTHAQVRALDLGVGAAMTDVVVMELLAGALTDPEEDRVRQFIRGFPFLPTAGLVDFQHAAALFRACRRGGETIRRMTACLIAAIAIRNGVPVLHNDSDFDALARHTRLQIA
jgi:predicted nucleic acid-binding protein